MKIHSNSGEKKKNVKEDAKKNDVRSVVGKPSDSKTPKNSLTAAELKKKENAEILLKLSMVISESYSQLC